MKAAKSGSGIDAPYDEKYGVDCGWNMPSLFSVCPCPSLLKELKFGCGLAGGQLTGFWSSGVVLCWAVDEQAKSTIKRYTQTVLLKKVRDVEIRMAANVFLLRKDKKQN
ncbi:MAG: hypothetical protein CL912_34070 [Deltaproteobacteria bacterium]|nr:hypothetical protein [Deltaproteobacteria bacterium]